MRSRLLQSFLFVLGFWWLVAAFYWSVSDPNVNLESLLRTKELIPWAEIVIPEHVNVLKAWDIQKQVLSFWSLPVTLVTLLSAGVGGGLVWLWAVVKNQERAERVKSQPEGYRGVTLTLGVLPVPQTPPLQKVGLRATDKALQVLTQGELATLTDVLGLLAANQECFAGENQPAGSLLQRTLKATYKALKDPDHPGPAALVAAASQLGKITAWKKDENGAWIRIKHEQREAARLLSALPSWWALPEVERLAVLYAVKYRGQIDLLPEVKDPAVYRLARALLEQREAEEPVAAAKPTEDVPTKAYEQRDPEVELLEVFEREVAMMPFQTMGLPKNIPAVGWKKGNRAYFLENRLTEHLMGKLSPTLQAAFAPSNEKVRVQKLTAALLKLFHEKGWLVCKHESDTVPPHEALWVIQAGKLEFSRVIILELPPELVERLPPKDSYYEVVVKRPLFQPSISNAISKDDLMGGLLRPKSSAQKPAKAEQRAEKDAQVESAEDTAKPVTVDPSEILLPPEKPKMNGHGGGDLTAPEKSQGERSSGKPVGKSEKRQRSGERKLLDPADLFP